jgi:hypothetical protein
MASFDTISFREGCLSKYKEITSKKQMVNSRSAFGNLESSNIFKPFFFEHQSKRRGSPCLKPLSGENKPKALSLIAKENEEEEMQVSIQLIQVAWYPKFLIMAKLESILFCTKPFPYPT